MTHLADELSRRKDNRSRRTVLEQIFYKQMGRALFDHADFLAAARDLAVEHGPSAVTVASLTERLEAPTGSVYHRFPPRDLLLGELGLQNILAYQEGVVAATDARD